MKAKYCWLFVPFCSGTYFKQNSRTMPKSIFTLHVQWQLCIDFARPTAWKSLFDFIFIALYFCFKTKLFGKKIFNVIADKKSIRRFSGCLSFEGKSVTGIFANRPFPVHLKGPQSILSGIEPSADSGSWVETYMSNTSNSSCLVWDHNVTFGVPLIKLRTLFSSVLLGFCWYLRWHVMYTFWCVHNMSEISWCCCTDITL